MCLSARVRVYYSACVTAHVPRKSPVSLIWAGFKTLNLRLWKTMRREPPPVKHHTRERTSNLPRQHSQDLAFKLPASGDRKTKRQCMYIPWFLHVRPALAVFPPVPPLAIIHHAITHTACVSLLYSSFLEQAQRLLHNQLILLCPKYLICINFITADLSYLRWIDLLWITRIVPHIPGFMFTK